MRCKSLKELGFPKYRIREDGKVTTLRMNRQGHYRWKVCTQKRVRGENSKPYLTVRVSHEGFRKTFLVHRLVLMAFVGPCPPGMEGCHNDNNPQNNHVDNLRWDTRSGNQRDRIKHGTSLRGRHINVGEDQWMAKLTWKKVRLIRRKYARGHYTYKQLAVLFEVSHWTIMSVVNEKSWIERNRPTFSQPSRLW